MKKAISLLLVLMMSISFSCFASEYSNIFVKCEQSAERMLAMFEDSSTPYTVVAKSFSPKMLEEFKEKNFEQLKKSIGEKYGSLVEKEFLAFTLFGNDGMGFAYKVIFSKGEAMAMLFVCDKDGKIFRYRFDPIIQK